MVRLQAFRGFKFGVQQSPKLTHRYHRIFKPTAMGCSNCVQPQTRWVNHHQLFASKRNILIPRLLKSILFEINRFAPLAAIWFCVVASFNSDFEINYLFWSDRTGWFVYRCLGASNLEFNNLQHLHVVLGVCSDRLHGIVQTYTTTNFMLQNGTS